MSETLIAAPERVADFSSLGLRAELLRALQATGYTTPTPIQAEAIPAILAGGDVLAAAQTGTGKTAGFTLPVLQRLMEAPVVGKPGKRPMTGREARRPIRALVLTPTRELAAQVEESIRTYGRFLLLTSTTVFGGVNINPQIKALARGVDLLVATPGRLLDHIQQQTVDLRQVEILILDEADRMLDMGFIRDIRRILEFLPAVRQRLLFSATFSEEIKSLADGFLREPRHVEVARPNEESALVTQSMVAIPQDQKRHLLVHLLGSEKINQVLVFTRTKHGADRLTRQLAQEGISAVAIHGNRSQSQRTLALGDFKAGRVRVLVATDIAARGLDIQQLPFVINYEIPNVPEDYVHRIGRTGRAGSPGEAISLVSPDERKFLVSIEKLTGKQIARRSVEGFTLVAEASTAGEEVQERPVYGAGRGVRPPRPRVHLEYPGRGDRPVRPISRTPRHRRKPAAPTG